MDNQVPNLRPNPERAIDIFGQFGEELSGKVLPQIIALRAKSSEPITAYINSPGGNSRVLDIIDGALRGPDIDGNKAPLITVGVGDCASAGAFLLSFGNYVYAHEHTLIHFHGVRAGEVQVTFEDASHLTDEIAQINRAISRKLSEAIIPRVLFRYQSQKTKFDRKRDCDGDDDLMELLCFVDTIKPNLSQQARGLVGKTLTHVRRARNLTSRILPSVKFTKRTNQAGNDAKVLRGVIAHDLKENKGKNWSLDERGMQRLLSDYFILRDYNLGDHQSTLRELFKFFAKEFLICDEVETLKKLEAQDLKKAELFLFQKTYPRLTSLWYYTVSLCRVLLQGENRIAPGDAYWLGIVDEVVGTNLRGARTICERRTDGEKSQANPTASSSELVPPSSQSKAAS